MTTSPKSETAAKKDVTKLQRAIVDGLEDVKAVDIQVFNTESLSPLFERVIVATGNSNRQTKALASSVRDAVKEAGFSKPRMEGEENGEWIIVDCGQAVAHIMQPAIRQYYRLEEIWGDTPVRLKLGAAKPRKLTASEDEAPAKGAAKPAGKAAAKKSAAVKKAPATRILEDGDVIDLGDRQFEIIHTPGHSPGGIALYEKATEILFSGDIVYDGPLIEDTYHSDLTDYIASMERLLTLPVRLVHGGHFPSFGRERYRQLIRGWLDEKQK